MRSSKKFDYGVGKYYLTINSIPNNITLSRDSAESALYIYNKYNDIGKEIEWLGCWNGKKFEETSPPKEEKKKKGVKN